METNKKIYDIIDVSVIRIATSHRGGGVEIMLDEFGYPNMRMTAYQNYLGGGLLGAIANDSTIRDWEDHADLVEIADNLRQYFFDRMKDNGYIDDYNSFDSLENRSVSAY